jgi:signal transduction histidine kinase
MSVLGEMTSGFAHELNQPLSAIRHYAQGCTIRLQKQDPQHPYCPRWATSINRLSAGRKRCAICAIGSARRTGARTSGDLGTYQRSSGY